jgi:hypothetical protein
MCCQLARKELNLRPASYKDAALTAELRASSWVGGIRTHTSLIKSQVCSRYTTTQYWLGRIRLLRKIVDIVFLRVVRDLFHFNKWWPWESNSAQRPYQGHLGNQPSTTESVGRFGVEPKPSCSQSRRASICTSARLSVRTVGIEPTISWPPAKRDTRLRHVLLFNDPCGS